MHTLKTLGFTYAPEKDDEGSRYVRELANGSSLVVFRPSEEFEDWNLYRFFSDGSQDWIDGFPTEEEACYAASKLL